MQLRLGAEYPGGAAGKSGHDQLHAGGQHHGQQTDGQHHAVRYVHQSGQSHGGCGDLGGAGGADAHAVHSRDAGTVGSRRPHRVAGQHAGA
jgi:hypothetical protein